MSRTRISTRRMKEIQVIHDAKRAAFLQSITTKDDFQRELTPVVNRLNADPGYYPAAIKMGSILMRGHQMLSSEEYWEVVNALEIDKEDAIYLVKDAIEQGTRRSVDAPFLDYMDELLKRGRKLAREMKAGKHNQEMFRMRLVALYQECEAMKRVWFEQQKDEMQAKIRERMFEMMFQSLTSWLEKDLKA